MRHASLNLLHLGAPIAIAFGAGFFAGVYLMVSMEQRRYRNSWMQPQQRYYAPKPRRPRRRKRR